MSGIRLSRGRFRTPVALRHNTSVSIFARRRDIIGQAAVRRVVVGMTGSNRRQLPCKGSAKSRLTLKSVLGVRPYTKIFSSRKTGVSNRGIARRINLENTNRSMC
jgi:hypothetical protein